MATGVQREVDTGPGHVFRGGASMAVTAIASLPTTTAGLAPTTNSATAAQGAYPGSYASGWHSVFLCPWKMGYNTHTWKVRSHCLVKRWLTNAENYASAFEGGKRRS